MRGTFFITTLLLPFLVATAPAQPAKRDAPSLESLQSDDCPQEFRLPVDLLADAARFWKARGLEFSPCGVLRSIGIGTKTTNGGSDTGTGTTEGSAVATASFATSTSSSSGLSENVSGDNAGGSGSNSGNGSSSSSAASGPGGTSTSLTGNGQAFANNGKSSSFKGSANGAGGGETATTAALPAQSSANSNLPLLPDFSGSGNGGGSSASSSSNNNNGVITTNGWEELPNAEQVYLGTTQATTDIGWAIALRWVLRSREGRHSIASSGSLFRIKSITHWKN